MFGLGGGEAGGEDVFEALDAVAYVAVGFEGFEESGEDVSGGGGAALVNNVHQELFRAAGDKGGGQVSPFPGEAFDLAEVAVEEFEVALAAGHEEADVVAEGGHLAAGAEDALDSAEALLLEVKVEGRPREAAYDAVDVFDALFGTNLFEVGDVAFYDVELRITTFPGGAEGGVAFDGEEAGAGAKAGEDGFGESTGAGAEFDDHLGIGEVERVGEMAGEEGRTRADGGDGKGIAGKLTEDEFEIAVGFCFCVSHPTILYQERGFVLGYLVTTRCV